VDLLDCAGLNVVKVKLAAAPAGTDRNSNVFVKDATCGSRLSGCIPEMSESHAALVGSTTCVSAALVLPGTIVAARASHCHTVSLTQCW
jgi:hypothetical protein